MLKVGSKRKRKERTKEREKAHKLDCQDSSSHFFAYCLLRLPETSPRSQGNKSKTSRVRSLNVGINHATHRLNKKNKQKKKTLLTRLQMQIWVKKVTLIVQISFAEKN